MKDCYKSFLIFVIFFALVQGRRVPNPCEPGKVPCDNEECIGNLNWCDENYDCSDESDEKYCLRKGWFGPIPENNCNEKHFECEDKMCIPISLRCDGLRDCYDSSDEKHCGSLDQDESVYSSEKEPEYVSTASTSTQEGLEYGFTNNTSVKKEIEYVSTASTPAQKEPEYISTTSIPAQKETYTTSHHASTVGFYDSSRTDESYNNNRRYGYNPSPPNMDDSYVPPPTPNYNINHETPYYPRYDGHPYYPRYPGHLYDSRYPEQPYYDSRYPEQPYDSRYPEQNKHRVSDRSGGGNFPSIHQPPYVSDTPTQEKSYRSQYVIRSRQDPLRPSYAYIGRETPTQLCTSGEKSGRTFTSANLSGGGSASLENTWFKLFFQFELNRKNY